jgi:hypothetical protein
VTMDGTSAHRMPGAGTVSGLTVSIHPPGGMVADSLGRRRRVGRHTPSAPERCCGLPGASGARARYRPSRPDGRFARRSLRLHDRLLNGEGRSRVTCSRRPGPTVEPVR